MAYPCIVCNVEILNIDTAIDCDQCHRWNHLYCGTGISIESYRTMNSNNGNITWRYRDCDASRANDIDNINQTGNIMEIDTLASIPVQIEPQAGIKVIPGGNNKGGVNSFVKKHANNCVCVYKVCIYIYIYIVRYDGVYVYIQYISIYI